MCARRPAVGGISAKGGPQEHLRPTFLPLGGTRPAAVRTRSAIVEIWQSAITGRLPAGRLHDLPDRQTLERGQEWDVPGMLARTGTTPMTREKIAA